SPRSLVRTSRSTRSSGRRARSGCASGPTPAATAANISVSFAAYGRARSAASCARRSFAAATIFIALVICCVERTVALRFRRAFRLGMDSRREVLPEVRERGVELDLHVVRQVLLLADQLQDVGVLCLEEGVELALVALDRAHRQGIQVSVGRRVD